MYSSKTFPWITDVKIDVFKFLKILKEFELRLIKMIYGKDDLIIIIGWIWENDYVRANQKVQNSFLKENDKDRIYVLTWCKGMT